MNEEKEEYDCSVTEKKRSLDELQEQSHLKQLVPLTNERNRTKPGWICPPLLSSTSRGRGRGRGRRPSTSEGFGGRPGWLCPVAGGEDAGDEAQEIGGCRIGTDERESKEGAKESSLKFAAFPFYPRIGFWCPTRNWARFSSNRLLFKQGLGAEFSFYPRVLRRSRCGGWWWQRPQQGEG